ncbi:MAG: flagellar hook-basal body complex protein, partial [Zoogloeaceae bacterium]|nr:flagellar hook-basal body complex protein [Zoogloeaceae bacterium]
MAFQQGLSGLNVYSKALDVISHNIANASTVGFKSSTAQFADVYAGSMGVSSGSQIGIGATLMGVAQNFAQGNVSASSNSLDIAINGNGFFRLQPSANDQTAYYTRNGQFHLNKDGYIQNANGLLLTGYLSTDGSTVDYARIQPLTVGTAGIEPKQTGWSQSLNADLGGYFLGVNLDNRDKKALSLAPLSPTVANAVAGATGADDAALAAIAAAAPATPTGLDAFLQEIYSANPPDAAAVSTAAGNHFATPLSTEAQQVVTAATTAANAANATHASVISAALRAAGASSADTSAVAAAVNAAKTTGSTLADVQSAVNALTDSEWTQLDPFKWDASFNSNMYNYSTSGIAYDQTGAQHKLTNYFVRASDSGESGRAWYVYSVLDDKYLIPHDSSASSVAPPDAYAQVLEFEPNGTMKPGIASRFELDLSNCIDQNGTVANLTSDTPPAGGVAHNWFAQTPGSTTANYAFLLDLSATTMFGVKYSQDS